MYCTAVDTTPRNYADSIAYCEQLGSWGNMAMMFTDITNCGVLGILWHWCYINNSLCNAGVAATTLASTPEANKKVWIGINDRVSEGTFYWMHGNNPAQGLYMNWAAGKLEFNICCYN
jgi:hypothetical protein